MQKDLIEKLKNKKHVHKRFPTTKGVFLKPYIHKLVSKPGFAPNWSHQFKLMYRIFQPEKKKEKKKKAYFNLPDLSHKFIYLTLGCSSPHNWCMVQKQLKILHLSFLNKKHKLFKKKIEESLFILEWLKRPMLA